MSYGGASKFPSTADSVAEWLEKINLSQHTPAFEGVSVSELLKLSDSRLRELVPLDGHRKRLVLAMRALGAGTVAAAAAAPKYNSTASMYIDSTISSPCTDEIIFCVSIVIHDRIEEGELRSKQTSEPRARHFPMIDKPLFPNEAPAEPGALPSEDTIFHAIKTIYSIAEFSPECLVVCLLYIERLRSLSGLQLLINNWQPMLLAGMVIAQKVWDDTSLLNCDFSLICSAYTLKDINVIELKFLELIEYNVSITASLYASYYFELRTLCEKSQRDFTLKPLDEAARKKLESTSLQKTDQFQKDKKAKSFDQVTAKANAKE